MLKQFNYDKIAQYYDMIESAYGPLEDFLLRTLKKHKAVKILDMTAGTGKQSIFLAERGFAVTSNDINPKMLAIAKSKAKAAKLKIRFNTGDMCTARLGKFDVVISLYNSIGHLSRKRFLLALENIKRNLKPKGIYIFDILDRGFTETQLPDYEFVGTSKTYGDIKIVVFIKYLAKGKALHVLQKILVQESMRRPFTIKESWDMNVYYYGELEKILKDAGLEIIKQESINANKNGSRAHFIVAKEY